MVITDHEFLVRLNKVLENYDKDSFTIQLDIQNQLNSDKDSGSKLLAIVFYPNGYEAQYKKEFTSHHSYIVCEQK